MLSARTSSRCGSTPDAEIRTPRIVFAFAPDLLNPLAAYIHFLGRRHPGSSFSSSALHERTQIDRLAAALRTRQQNFATSDSGYADLPPVDVIFVSEEDTA